jgi:formate hydrogenlyase subunit 6/NADH:ubiquinone oxidoreductase subunit I
VIFGTLLKQLLSKPATNPFPVKYMPRSVTAVLQKVAAGQVAIHPPIPTPKDLRGKIAYDREKCIGCGLCVRVCPASVIELYKPEGEEKSKIRMYVARCTFCAQCVDACPVGALAMTDEFLLANTDRFSENLIID